MSVSTDLEILQVTETQASKVTAMNTAFSQMEKVISGKYALNTDSATSSGDIITLPYDDSGDLTDRTALRFIYLELVAGATADFKVVHPAKPHMFFVRNNTLYVATFAAGGTTVQVQPQTGQILYCDGNDFFLLMEDTRMVSNDFDIQYWGTPGPSEVIADIIVARDTTIIDNMTGAVGRAANNPASTYVIDVYDSGTKFGEISISAIGAFNFSHTVSGDRVISAGDRLRLVGNAVEDPDISGIQIAIPATTLL